jgi:peptidoglycan/LPS O-acetylase OafA/YrhL
MGENVERQLKRFPRAASIVLILLICCLSYVYYEYSQHHTFGNVIALGAFLLVPLALVGLIVSLASYSRKGTARSSLDIIVSLFLISVAVLIYYAYYFLTELP